MGSVWFTVFDHTVQRTARTEDEEDSPTKRHPVPAVHIGESSFLFGFLSSSRRVVVSSLSFDLKGLTIFLLLLLLPLLATVQTKVRPFLPLHPFAARRVSFLSAPADFSSFPPLVAPPLSLQPQRQASHDFTSISIPLTSQPLSLIDLNSSTSGNLWGIPRRRPSRIGRLRSQMRTL